jgi:L-serine dehydratase
MISLFDLFKIGIGPSSSHTVGPMVAARRFATRLGEEPKPAEVERIVVELFGSLALTGVGHATDRAVLLGLQGEHPETVPTERMHSVVESIQANRVINWLGKNQIAFNLERDLIFHRDQVLQKHPNGLRFTAYTNAGQTLLSEQYYSVGGGFVMTETEFETPSIDAEGKQPPLPFNCCNDLLSICDSERLSFAEVVHRNELTWRSENQIADGLDRIWSVMKSSIEQGCKTTGVLPGGLNTRRRAPELFAKLTANNQQDPSVPGEPMDWATMFALAVNEENAAGGRVVTAPTNGASGVIPAVLAFCEKFHRQCDRSGIHAFLKTAAAVGFLYKRNASLSAAEMGCQGEVGVACSMAAAGMACILGGTPQQIENAAEIGMEHNLGLTCDPIAGLVQIPCIERNTMGAVKAINAARLAVLYGDGRHRVPLDRVIETMRQTGIDMQSKYKETSLGGLAVNVINC